MTPTTDKKPARTRKPGAAGTTPPPASTDLDRARRIAIEAYFLAEARGFAPGGELEDWLAAEAKIDGHPRS